MLESSLRMGLMVAAMPMHAGADRPVSQGMPSPLWRGAVSISLACSAGIDASLCDVVRRRVRVRSPLPITSASKHEGARVEDRGIVLLTVATEGRGADRHLTAVARRAVEIDDAEAPIRHTAPWPPATDAEAALDRLLTAILPRASGRASHDRQPVSYRI